MSFQETEAPVTDEPDAPEAVEAPDSAVGTSEQSDDFGSPEGFDLESLSPEERKIAEQYEKQFKGHYTKKTQELADQRKTYEAKLQAAETWERLRNDKETQLDVFRQIAELHGIELEGFETETEQEVDPDEWEAEHETDEPHLDPRYTEELERREAEAQQQEIGTAYQAALQKVAEPLGRELTPHEKEIFDVAVPRLVEEGPIGEAVSKAVEKAAELILALEGDVKERWIESKDAPFISKNGKAGTEKYDPTDAASRKRYAIQVAEASLNQSNT